MGVGQRVLKCRLNKCWPIVQVNVRRRYSDDFLRTFSVGIFSSSIASIFFLRWFLLFRMVEGLGVMGVSKK